MGMNHLILALVSLSCLFSFSTSTSTPPSYSYHYSFSHSSSSAPSAAFNVHFPKSSGTRIDQTFNKLPTLPTKNVDPGLQQICKDTDHPVECISNIVPFLGHSKFVAEPVSVLKLEIQAMDNKVKEAIDKATKLMQDHSTQKMTASCLETCLDSYKSILDSDKRALDALSLHDVYQVSMELSSNIENVQTCEDAFLEANLKSPNIQMDSVIRKMISNTLAIGVDKVHF
ncbi:hypothetical protein ERO13_A08G040400v2 [Gossypium hirsutum]|uniref:Pectinesterase inhibitor domain-containing protein n=6 Tax=Gossypium TaxID=3633 RepID=A0ABR0NWW1_GOSAR|nr:uncharacterized protein LOC107953563 [Gossypium hirsutum]XP_017624830.1 uncharacterized protein LOC108468460 [Gossypium arboreum]KAB2068642.1 hypothetical protein ES319_A08G045700v1 [Gossypium barbadense]TYH04981.1 hypothetical protein ES288_A08G048700v1 [Gossypium darwinii]TYI13310.1 hypothetical protein ES332_A08G049800v1 [Gossypium tomentosum]TYJ21192.1 hypothetical protein E1A91_A08G048600v1 [Gossypium mustelinum]KAG4186368.1 hypothetical protein ERO13_A08G040400v2 [Gossypium hirsutum]